MSKRKGEAGHLSPLTTQGAAADPSIEEAPLVPSARTRWIVSGLIALHFTALGIALSANMAPSFLHGEILPWLAPAHVTTAQDYVLLPLELTHAARIDMPLVADVRLVGDPRWRRIRLPQIASSASTAANSEQQIVDWSSSRSRWPNLSRLITWIALEQPNSEVLPEFALQLLKYAAACEPSWQLESLAEIRLLQPHVLTYDEWIMLDRGQDSLLGDALSGQVVYGAKVIHTAGGELRLMPWQEPAMTSKPLSTPLTTPLSAPSTKPAGVTAP